MTPEQYEFQMLLGVRELAANRLVRDGHRLRIYVPFGEHWYRYSLRRLQENPKIAGYVASDTHESAVRRGRPLSYRRFFLIRLAQALFAIWLVATLVFVMFFVLLPKPARNLAGGGRRPRP